MGMFSKKGVQFLTRRFSSGIDLNHRRKRLIFRSTQRGWLELDVLLSNFARRNAPTMTESQMSGYEEVLDMETPDLFTWISGQKPIPQEYQDHEMLNKLRRYVLSDIPDKCAQ